MHLMQAPSAQSVCLAQRLRALLSVVVLLALVLTQSLGLLHAVAHSHSRSHGQEHVAPLHAQEVGTHVAGTHVLSDFLVHLFDAHEEEGADCRLYDQSTHGDTGPGVPLLVLPLVIAPFTYSVLTGLAVARWHALFQARGPPSFR